MNAMRQKNAKPGPSVVLRLLAALVLVAIGGPLVAATSTPTLLRVVGDNHYPPYLFLDDEGRATGYLVDIWRLWSEKTGIEVELTALEWAEAQRRLLAGEADVIDNIFRTPERESFYDFSAPYARLPVSIYRDVSIDGIHDLRALRGFKVGVMAGDACIEYLERAGITGLILYPTYSDLIRGALAEEVKLFCLDEHPANYYLYRLDAHQRFQQAFSLYEGQFHRAVRKGDRAILELVAQGMAAISAEEEAAIRRQWMKRVIDYGPWVRGLGLATALLLALGLTLGTWTHMLRKRVRTQTEELRTALREVQQARRESEMARERLEQEVVERTAALRAAVDEQQVILDTATSGIALIKDRILMRCNRKLHEIFGWPQGTMVGQRTAIWYPDEAANHAGGDPVYAHIWRGEMHRREQQLIRRDGSLFWARLSGNAIDSRDHTKGTVWVIDDISAEHEAIERMREARALAEEAARTKSDFLANMSHEVRTPMNTILGMTHLLLKTELSERQQGHLLQIQAAGERLMAIINEILDFSRIETGKLKVSQRQFVIAQVVEDVAALISGPCVAKRLNLRTFVDPAVPRRLVGDPLRLRQILISYAKNAVKFTEQGEIRIEASLLARDEQGVRVRLLVRDTGIGIDETQRRLLFQSFRQVDGSTKRRYGGTGLGLALAQRLAELMGGEVGVASEPGVGSEFWLIAHFGIASEQPEGLVSSGPRAHAEGSRAPRRSPGSTASTRSDATEAQPPRDVRAEASRRRQLAETLAQLTRQLADDDFEAVDTLEMSRNLLMNALGDHYEPIAKAVHGYDFNAAARQLEQVSRALGLGLGDDTGITSS
ncbi:MAG: transporter substrate-binding domain-containing protein [Sphingobacteriia bacterium]|nr:transporter substrate-binding domain-containing protein [Sphingobacteriia bacterium]NCC38128.1 transporter substrate-binding domain-containing protein [Gammaproteobacteria bacterium]